MKLLGYLVGKILKDLDCCFRQEKNESFNMKQIHTELNAK